MKIYKCLLTNNDCYKKAKKMKPKGIVVHSTGANNPNLKRYVQPDDGILGDNKYNNDWNKPGISKCVNAFIGKDKNGDVKCYQTLPFDYAPWGVGSGKKGSYNSTHIQFEICEDNLKDKDYFNKAFELSAELCAYLCKEYNLPVNTIVSHKEAHKNGYGSNHGDCDHWLKNFGKDMDWFRNLVQSKLNKQETEPKPTTTTTKPKTETTTKPKVDYAKSQNKKYSSGKTYKTTSDLHLRTGASTKKTSVGIMAKGDKVKWYGYYTDNWKLVKVTSGKLKGKTGFCSGNYLK